MHRISALWHEQPPFRVMIQTAFRRIT